MIWIGLALLGVFVGFIGTVIGAGGGFILMPVLALLYPKQAPETLASISLAVVFFNALSGSLGYAKRKQIDYRRGVPFAIAGVPGAIGGAFVTAMISRAVFDSLLGAVLLGIGGWLLAVGSTRGARGTDETDRGQQVRRMWLGIVISFLVGFVSSLLGIGGGIIHVPAMVYALGFPVHMATATSHFVLAATSGAGTAVHIATGSFHEMVQLTLWLALGVVIGAQVGAHYSKRIRAAWIIRGLGVALLVVGVRLIYGVIAHGA